MKLLAPDTEEKMELIKSYTKKGDRAASNIERSKLQQMRKEHGIYMSLTMANVLQMPVHLVYISLINRLSYNVDINPAMLTDGVLWFKDLTAPDPLGIMPVLGGFMSLLNIMSASAANSNNNFRKMSKFMRIIPLISVPVWMTFPAAFNIYWIVNSGMQLAIVSAVRSEKFRSFFGMKDFLPGTKLERLNMGTKSQTVDMPVIQLSRPGGTRKKMKGVGK